MRRDESGIWLAAYAIALAFCALVAIAQLGCSHHLPRPQAREPAPRTITVTLRCLTQAPPEPPQYDSDPAIARAQLEQAYDALALWAYLYAWPSCRE